MRILPFMIFAISALLTLSACTGHALKSQPIILSQNETGEANVGYDDDFTKMVKGADLFAQQYHASVTRDNRPFLKYDVLSIQGVRSDNQSYSVVRYRWIDHDITGEKIVDSRTCPQVDTVIIAFDNLSVPLPRLLDLQGRAHPTLIEGPPDELLTGSGNLRVRARARFENLSSAELTFTANANSETDHWFSQTLTELASCWRSNPE